MRPGNEYFCRLGFFESKAAWTTSLRLLVSLLILASAPACFSEILPTDTVTTIAGGSPGFSGDGGAAKLATFRLDRFVTVRALVVDSHGNIVLADTSNNRVRLISTDGIITTIAGSSGGAGFYGDGGSATAASLSRPGSVNVDRGGRVHIGDTYNGRVRRINANGTIQTVAGGGSITLSQVPLYLFLGEPLFGSQINLDVVRDIAFDSRNNMNVSATSQDGSVQTIGVTPDGTLQVGCCASGVFDLDGNRYYSLGNKVYKNSSAIAGTGVAGFFGDGVPALSSQLWEPGQVAVDAEGNVYVADTYNRRIRKITPSGMITTVVGSGQRAFGRGADGDGGPAGQARLGLVNGLGFDPAGNLYFAEMVGDGNFEPDGAASIVHRIRKVEIDPASQRPVISDGGITDPWTYSPGLSVGGWATIFGQYLSSQEASWAPNPGELLPTSLAGVVAKINGVPSPISYVSNKIMNILVPGSVSTGPGTLVIERDGMSSLPVPINVARMNPAIYSLPLLSGSTVTFHVTAALAGTGSLVGSSAVDSRASRGARPGELIDLYVVGLGQTVGGFPTDSLFSGAFQIAEPITVKLGTETITPGFAGLISPGLYLVRITIPPTTPSGDASIRIMSNEIVSAANVFLAIEGNH